MNTTKGPKENWARSYFYGLISRYLSVFLRPGDYSAEIDPHSDFLLRAIPGIKALFISKPPDPTFESVSVLRREAAEQDKPDYILLNGNVHYERDIQAFLKNVSAICKPSSRLIVIYYSGAWKLLISLATLLGLRTKTPEQNWIAPEDLNNLLNLSDFEKVTDDCKVLLPVYIPLLSSLLNRYVAPLPGFRSFCVLHICLARPVGLPPEKRPSVSVIIPARNEEGNIENAVRRLPTMGPDDEIIFVEGNSTDATWNTILAIKEKYGASHNIVTARQGGKGKGDAVRKGFSLATKEILMILDADLTVPPESLPLFYNALVQQKGEFINGSRLVYPMDEKAMQFVNMLGNKFFASAFSFMLGQRFRDTLCGTKVLSRENYQKIASHRSFFGEFDPFGDFDLLFGAARLGLKIIEVPIGYKERTYGTTNIQRWRHGAILMRMLAYAGRKIKFV